jgi:hypothetical protein
MRAIQRFLARRAPRPLPPPPVRSPPAQPVQCVASAGCPLPPPPAQVPPTQPVLCDAPAWSSPLLPPPLLGPSGLAGPRQTQCPATPCSALPLLPLDVACIPRPSTASCGSTILSTSPKPPPTPTAAALLADAPSAAERLVRPHALKATGIAWLTTSVSASATTSASYHLSAWSTRA